MPNNTTAKPEDIQYIDASDPVRDPETDKWTVWFTKKDDGIKRGSKEFATEAKALAWIDDNVKPR